MSVVYVYIPKHTRLGGLGVCSPRKFFELDALRLLLRPFWDRSRAVYSSYIVRGVLHPIFGCPRMHLVCQQT